MNGIHVRQRPVCGPKCEPRQRRRQFRATERPQQQHSTAHACTRYKVCAAMKSESTTKYVLKTIYHPGSYVCALKTIVLFGREKLEDKMFL